jgi:hypothetical protein
MLYVAKINPLVMLDNDEAFGGLRCTYFITNNRYEFSDFLFIQLA